MNERNDGKLLRCGAKNRQGLPCRRAPMANGRCHLHGGKSTGPKTAAGLERITEARTIHGMYSRASRESAQELRNLVRQFRELQRSI
jgi:hypothetical protein